MHAISSYRGNRHTHTGSITIHCAAASAQCLNQQTNTAHCLAVNCESKQFWADSLPDATNDSLYVSNMNRNWAAQCSQKVHCFYHQAMAAPDIHS